MSPDHLPPFTTLENEEDWEMKAGHCAPGTYYVVANSRSFATPSDQRAELSPVSPMGAFEASSRQESVLRIANGSVSDDELSSRIANIALDDATLILGSFADSTRQPLSSSSAQSLVLHFDSDSSLPQTPTSATFFRSAEAAMSRYQHLQQHPNRSSPHEDQRQIHYRTVIRRYIFGAVDDGQTQSPDVADFFEQEAQRFPLVSTNSY